MSKKLVITKGSGGYGGPLEIDVSDSAKKIMYMTGGVKPAVVDTLSEMTGLKVVNAFKKKAPDDEVAVAVVDCGGGPFAVACIRRRGFPRSTLATRAFRAPSPSS